MSTKLPDLVKKINKAHTAGETAFRKSLEHFRTAGEALIEAKTQVKESGEGWLKWLAENCAFSQQRASEYMRLAIGWEQLPPGGTFGLKEALAIISGEIPKKRSPGKNVAPPLHLPPAEPVDDVPPLETPVVAEPEAEEAIAEDGPKQFTVWLTPDEALAFKDQLDRLKSKYETRNDQETIREAVRREAEVING
jgi:hypothetical protein